MSLTSQKYLICLLLLVALVPLMLLRDFTPSNELRYLSIADEALRNGQFFAFTNHGLPYADKPPLYLWIVMAGRTLFGGNCMWFLTLFSILPALAIALVMDRWTDRLISPSWQKSAMLMLMSCGMFLGAAIVVRMDMLMCLFIVLSLYVFYRRYECGAEDRRWCGPLFPVFIFMAIFSKGPMGFLIPLVSTLAFLAISGKWKMAAVFWGWRTWAILLGACVAWFAMVYYEGGNDYLYNLLVHQTVDRAVNAFTHSRPFYYYFYSSLYCMLPWSLLIIGATVAAICKRGLWQDSICRFFLVTVGCVFVILSCISSKIDIYLVPAYPFAIYVGVISLQRLGRSRWLDAAVAVPCAVFVLAFPAMLVAASQPGLNYLGSPYFYAASGVLSLAGVISLWLLYGRKAMDRSVQAFSAGLFLALFVGAWGLPSVNDRMGYAQVCREAAEVAAQEKIERISTWHMSRAENMDVYLGRQVEVLPKEQVPASDGQPRVLIVPVKWLDEMPHHRVLRLVGENAVTVL